MMKDISGRHFLSNEEVKEEADEWNNTKGPKIFTSGMMALNCMKYIMLEGNYIEKEEVHLKWKVGWLLTDLPSWLQTR